jgi:hypothetical protein
MAENGSGQPEGITLLRALTVRSSAVFECQNQESMKQETEIRKVFDGVQQSLDTLQGACATCLFIGHEGNHFVMSGNPVNITAQLLLAMCRYPVVRDIVKTCAERFDEMDQEFGEGVRNMTMDHLIEMNSGN